MSQIPSNDILESLHKLRIRDSTLYWNCTTWRCIRRYRFPIIKKTKKTMVKTNIDQQLRLRNFDARHGRIESGAVVKNRKGLISVAGGKGICYQWKEKSQCSQGDPLQFPSRDPRSYTKIRTHCRHAFRANRITRSKCVEEKKYQRQK